MAKKMMSLFCVKVIGLVVVLALITSNLASGVTCQDGTNTLFPCMEFLVGGGPAQPTAQCCSGVKALKRLATTRDERRTLCQCFKDSGSSLGVNLDRAKLLPQICKVNVGIDISPSVDCQSIR